MLLNPFGQFGSFICPTEAFVGENHNTVIGFPSNCSSYALGSMPHGVEGQKVVFSYLETVVKFTVTRLSYASEVFEKVVKRLLRDIPQFTLY